MTTEVMEKTASLETEIKFNFHPYDYENLGHVIEKSEGTKKRRYLTGIASGIRLDQHGEKMTEKAMNSFMNQANSGTVLLYPDVHGIRASEDIGILKTAKILPTGDWYVEFRLYDEDDQVPQSKIDVIDTIWKQMTGQPPYTKPLQKGFSIEGFVPAGGMREINSQGQRTIDDVKLDGVVLVPRPAYKDGVANALYKALGELPPWQAEKYQERVRKTLFDKLAEKKERQSFYTAKFDLQDALEEELEKLMSNIRLTDSQRRSELELLFDEYKNSYIDLIVNMPNLYLKDKEENEGLESQEKRSKLIMALNKNYESLKQIIEAKRRP